MQSAKISFYIPLLAGGGAERVFLTLASELANKGHKIQLILNSSAKEKNPYLSEVPENIQIIDLKVSSTRAAISRLAAYIKQSQPDFCFSTICHANISLVMARIMAFGSKTKIIIRESNHLSRSLSGLSPLKQLILKLLVITLYPFADIIISPSKGVAKQLASWLPLGQSKIRTIPNPTVTKEMLMKGNEALPSEWQEVFNTPNCKIILSVGSLTKQKDFPTLINAFSKLKQDTNAKLIILGEGEERAKLEQLVTELKLSESVYLPGFQKNPFPFMAKANVYVLSSLWEGLPNAPIQAMAFGTNIVATDCPSGPDEILEGGKWGKLVPMTNPEKLAQSIKEILETPNSKEELIARSLFYSPEKILPQYDHLISGHWSQGE